MGLANFCGAAGVGMVLPKILLLPTSNMLFREESQLSSFGLHSILAVAKAWVSDLSADLCGWNVLSGLARQSLITTISKFV